MKPKCKPRGDRAPRPVGVPREDVEPLCWALARVVRLWREDRGCSLEKLEERSGVSRQMISYIESQRSVPTLDKLVPLARGMDMHADQLLLLARQWLQLKTKAAARAM